MIDFDRLTDLTTAQGFLGGVSAGACCVALRGGQSPSILDPLRSVDQLLGRLKVCAPWEPWDFQIYFPRCVRSLERVVSRKEEYDAEEIAVLCIPYWSKRNITICARKHLLWSVSYLEKTLWSASKSSTGGRKVKHKSVKVTISIRRYLNRIASSLFRELTPPD